MDVLSEVLRAVRLEGALFFNGEFSAPWSFRAPRSIGIAPYLAPGAGHLIIYHFVTEGRAYVRLRDGGRVELAAGDIIVVPHGDPHILGNGSPERPIDSLKMFQKNLVHGLKTARFGGGGEVTHFVCGYMACDPKLSEILLSGLPKLLKVHVADEPSGEWLRSSIRFAVGDGNQSHPGSGLVHAKLSEVLFVETLRRYIALLPSGQIGWLAGARDPAVGHAMALLHRDPATAWTVGSLARKVGLSRSRLAARFRHFLGDSPIAYLGRWRLRLAAGMLESSNDSVAEIAAAVGYGSESALNRAFSREFGCPPARFRRDRKRLVAAK